MALTVTIGETGTNGNKRYSRGTIGFDADNYPAGGEALSANDIGFRTIDHIQFMNGRHGVLYYTDTALPATSINVEILCPSGGAAPTSLAAPSDTAAASAIMTASGADSTNLVDHTHVAGAITETGGIGVEFGAGDASAASLVPFYAIGV